MPLGLVGGVFKPFCSIYLSNMLIVVHAPVCNEGVELIPLDKSNDYIVSNFHRQL